MDEYEKELKRQERMDRIFEILMLAALAIAVVLLFLVLILVTILVVELAKDISLIQKLTVISIIGAVIFQFLNVIRK